MSPIDDYLAYFYNKSLKLKPLLFYSKLDSTISVCVCVNLTILIHFYLTNTIKETGKIKLNKKVPREQQIFIGGC